MTFRNGGDDFEAKKFIGEKYQAKDPTAIPIPHTIKKLEVDIEDTSVASIQSKRTAILELAQAFSKIPGPFQKVLLDLYNVGPTADLIDDLEKNKTLLDSPEFQALIEQARQGMLPTEEAKALVTLLKFLSQQSPTPKPEDMAMTSKNSNPGKTSGAGAEELNQPQPTQSQAEATLPTKKGA
jgi:hypothetical protein